MSIEVRKGDWVEWSVTGFKDEDKGVIDWDLALVIKVNSDGSLVLNITGEHASNFRQRTQVLHADAKLPELKAAYEDPRQGRWREGPSHEQRVAVQALKAELEDLKARLIELEQREQAPAATGRKK